MFQRHKFFTFKNKNNMKKILILLLIILSLFNLSIVNNTNKTGKATYYDTTPHPKVNRPYSTAAYCHFKYKNMRMVITNLKNKVIDTVVITDRHSMGVNHVDLNHLCFDRLTKLDTITDIKKKERMRKKIGVIPIQFKLINN